MFESIKIRLTELQRAAFEVCEESAPIIEAKLRSDATTRRGNVPSFGPMGNVQIAVEVRPEAIVVQGPDWVLEKAQELGQIDEWTQMVLDVAGAKLEGK